MAIEQIRLAPRQRLYITSQRGAKEGSEAAVSGLGPLVVVVGRVCVCQAKKFCAVGTSVVVSICLTYLLETTYCPFVRVTVIVS